MSEAIDPELKARIVKARAMEPIDRMRRKARALTAVFEAIDPLTLAERVEMLEEILEVLDPAGADEC